jgi:ribosomal protein S18 acetylase RimI-like enzyme
MITIDYAKSDDMEMMYELFGDWDKDYRVDRELFAASFARVIAEENNALLVARDGSDIVGYVQLYECNELGFEPFYEVAELLVSARYRSRGVGRLLMERVEEIARADGIREIKLSSQVHRSRAHVFYENIGFEFYKISKFYGKKID